MKYPFTPEILDALPEELAELFRGLELKLLQEICSRLKKADKLNEVTIQDIRALRSHGIDLKDIEIAIRETADISEDKLNGLFDDVIALNQVYYKEIIDLAKVTEPQTLVDADDINAIRRQTIGEFRNLTQSMGFLVDKGQTMLSPAKAYQWAVDSAALQVQSGAISYDSAIRMSVKQLADSGLIVWRDIEGNIQKNKVRYESGHKDQLDVAVRRAVMTGVNQINSKYREQSMEYLETDLVEVTAHLGARNIDGPKGWENHAKWQGKVYRVKDKPRASSGEYDYLEDACGYGDVTGILGANCRHSFWPFIEGVSERTYTDSELESMKPENRPKIEFEGKEYDDYKATQKQREIERTIRKLKREKTAFESAGLKDDAQATDIHIKRLQQKYKEFSKAAGLPEQRERMNAVYADSITDIKKFAPLKDCHGKISVVGKFSERKYVVNVDRTVIDRTRAHFEENLSNRSDRAGLTVDVAQSIINDSKLVLYQTDRQTIKFLSENGYAVVNLSNELITVVPERLRIKYKKYLEEK